MGCMRAVGKKERERKGRIRGGREKGEGGKSTRDREEGRRYSETASVQVCSNLMLLCYCLL